MDTAATRRQAHRWTRWAQWDRATPPLPCLCTIARSCAVSPKRAATTARRIRARQLLSFCMISCFPDCTTLITAVACAGVQRRHDGLLRCPPSLPLPCVRVFAHRSAASSAVPLWSARSRCSFCGLPHCSLCGATSPGTTSGGPPGARATPQCVFVCLPPAASFASLYSGRLTVPGSDTPWASATSVSSPHQRRAADQCTYPLAASSLLAVAVVVLDSVLYVSDCESAEREREQAPHTQRSSGSLSDRSSL